MSLKAIRVLIPQTRFMLKPLFYPESLRRTPLYEIRQFGERKPSNADFCSEMGVEPERDRAEDWGRFRLRVRWPIDGF